MRLTTFTDFALRTLMRLAGAPDRSFTTEEIADEFGISRNHLVKVVGTLGKAGYIRTQRGTGGGFRLVRRRRSGSATWCAALRRASHWSSAFAPMAAPV